MTPGISRLLHAAPTAVFALAAAFVASMFALGADPSSAVAWRTFMALAPLAREPVELVAGGLGVHHGWVLVLLCGCVLAGTVAMTSGRALHSLRFVHAHGALLMLSVGLARANAFQAGEGDVFSGELWFALPMAADFARLPGYGLALAAAVLAACLACHASIIAHLVRRHRVERAIEARLVEALRAFG